MIFISYQFVYFAAAFYVLYYLAFWPGPRLLVIVAGGLAFQTWFGGVESAVVAAVLASATFLAGLSGNRRALTGTIAVSVLVLLFYKYTLFLVGSVVAPILPGLGARLVDLTKADLSLTIPLGISFFTFEFVHYLSDVQRGTAPIRRPTEFAAFIFYWPTMVAGPIKRYEQFVPAMQRGLLTPTMEDAAAGLSRVAIGMTKKWVADNLSGWIDFVQPQYAQGSLGDRWLFLGAVAMRIYLDFGGYSDMAIGFARLMGIAVPENFNWPYIARSPMEFWRRWHISLSTWIRDYVYIPLGGNRLGPLRRIVNAIIAMALCGLWHGAAWNFVIWGIYHGIGLTVGTLLETRFGYLVGAPAAVNASIGGPAELVVSRGPDRPERRLGFVALRLLCWAATMLFVSVGWLLFFYPVSDAAEMTLLLFRW